MFYPEFGENLKTLRKSLNLTQEDFGRRVGISKAVISKYETGIGSPTPNALRNIAACYGVSTDYLLGIPGKKTADLNGLSESQTEAVYRLITEFKRANEKAPEKVREKVRENVQENVQEKTAKQKDQKSDSRRRGPSLSM